MLDWILVIELHFQSPPPGQGVGLKILSPSNLPVGYSGNQLLSWGYVEAPPKVISLAYKRHWSHSGNSKGFRSSVPDLCRQRPNICIYLIARGEEQKFRWASLEAGRLWIQRYESKRAEQKDEEGRENLSALYFWWVEEWFQDWVAVLVAVIQK